MDQYCSNELTQLKSKKDGLKKSIDELNKTLLYLTTEHQEITSKYHRLLDYSEIKKKEVNQWRL